MTNARAFHEQDTEQQPTQGKAPKAAGAFRTISEVAEDLNVPQHVLRFWETRFSQIRPLKRGGGRRYYRPEDIALITRIHHLLYAEGYTIKGVQKLLKANSRAQFMGERAVPQAGETAERAAAVTGVASASVHTALSSAQRSALATVMAELQELRRLLKDATGQ